MRTCLVIDSMHESLFTMLKEAGWEVDYRPGLSREEVKTAVSGKHGLIVRSKTIVDRDLLGESPTIQFVGRAGAGLDILDREFLAQKGIHVLHASEGNRDAVGEYAVGALVSLMRNIPRADHEVRNMIWNREENRGTEIMGKTIGIIGYGNMGRAFAKRLSGFGCMIISFDKYKTGFSDDFCTEVGMDRIFEESDILSFHIPLTPETRLMADRHYFESFRKRIIVLNTARGEIVSLKDLADLMESGKVRGAVLDVLENEKLEKLTPGQLEDFNKLRKRTDVIFTPHIAGWTFESHVKINVALVDKIKSLPLE